MIIFHWLYSLWVGYWVGCGAIALTCGAVAGLIQLIFWVVENKNNPDKIAHALGTFVLVLLVYVGPVCLLAKIWDGPIEIFLNKYYLGLPVTLAFVYVWLKLVCWLSQPSRN